MQPDSITARARRRRIRLLAVLSVLTRRPPTSLRPQHYHSIAAILDDDHFKTMFGVCIDEFENIHAVLLLPNPVRTTSQDVIDSKTALLMLLAWLRGSRLRALEGQFGWSHSRCSRIIHVVSDTIYKMWGRHLDATSERHTLLRPERLDVYAAAIEQKTRMPRFWGAVDGTVRPIAMPMIDQEDSYNGHKRVHALKYQFIATPDGLLFISPPYPGRRGDGHMVSEEKLVQWAVRNARGVDGTPRFLYGDQAYGNSAAICSPFKGNFITREQMLTNHIMSKYRIIVEWGIGMVSMQWPRFRDKQYQRTGLTPCGRDFLVGTLLRNARTCYQWGNQISDAMHCKPPSLEEYFSPARVVAPRVQEQPMQEHMQEHGNAMEDRDEDSDASHVDRAL